MNEIINLQKCTKKQLILEIRRCWHNEDVHYENNELFNDWTDEFLILNGLSDYVQPLHDFFCEMMEQEDEQDYENMILEREQNETSSR